MNFTKPVLGSFIDNLENQSISSDDESYLDEIYLDEPSTPEISFRDLNLKNARKLVDTKPINVLPTGDASQDFLKPKPPSISNTFIDKPINKSANQKKFLLPNPIEIPPLFPTNKEFETKFKYTDQLTPNPPLGIPKKPFNSPNRELFNPSFKNSPITESNITSLLSKIHYNTKEWLPLYKSKVVDFDFRENYTYIKNIARLTITQLTKNKKLYNKYPILNKWIVCIIKDTYADLYVVANLWYLWYNDRLFDPDESQDEDTEIFIQQQLTRKSHSLNIPKEDSCEYNFLLNAFLIIRRKSLRLTWDHKVEVDLKPQVKGVKIIWDEIWLPLLYNITKRILAGKLSKPSN